MNDNQLHNEHVVSFWKNLKDTALYLDRYIAAVFFNNFAYFERKGWPEKDEDLAPRYRKKKGG